MRRPNALVMVFLLATAAYIGSYTYVAEGQANEAAAGFDNAPVPGFYPGTAAQQQAAFDADKVTFEERDEIADGLGPVYNAQGCVECHQNPVTGGIAQTTELRAGHLNGATFVDAPGGSLINDRAVNAAIQERVPGAENVRTFRFANNTLGDGFVEAIANGTLIALANAQPGQSGGQIAGQVINVPILECSNQPVAGCVQANATRVGRFGHKNQQASLLSFSSDAYLNEVGITNRFNLVENTSMGNSVAAFDNADNDDDADCEDIPGTTCGEDTEDDISVFARFMRASKAPPRGAISADANAGQTLFNNIGCGICHTPAITTAAPNTLINGGAFRVPAALGNKVLRAFSDFLLHDVGTGDGIVQNGGQGTRNKVRTRPLWGVRTTARHMHDGETLTFNESILRHAGEATGVINNYRNLNNAQQNQIVTFLQSL